MKIVDAGSFSRAATIIHVAQPALSQQIAELEERLGVQVLQRHARGVRVTPAGQVLYREATAILRQMEQLPGIVRSTGGEPEGSVVLGMSSTLAASIGGLFVQFCRAALPKVMVRFVSADSETLRGQISAYSLDLAVCFEDEPEGSFSRRPLFRQRLYYVARNGVPNTVGTMSFKHLATLPLVLPAAPNVVRTVLDREFAAANQTPNVVSEGNQFSSLLASVRLGLGGTVLPRGDRRPGSGIEDMAEPIALEPAVFITASVLWSSEVPLSRAAEAVRLALVDYLDTYANDASLPGLEQVGH